MKDNTELTPGIEEDLDLQQLQQKVLDLQAALLEAENKANANWDLLLRAKADEENLRKRSRSDVENAHRYGVEKFARSMLNVVDSLEKGIESSDIDNINANGDISSDNIVKILKDGMELTLKLLLNNLEQFGINMIDPVGETFDPTKHEALSMQEHATAGHNTIIMVVQKGFVIHDRVLRHAKVIVAKRT